MHLADQVRRDLAGAEAGHLDLRRHALDLAVDPRVDVLGGDGQRVGPLEARVFRLDGLHDAVVYPAVNWSVLERPMQPWRTWCGRRDSNPHILRYWYLKPARLPIPPRPRGRSSKCAAYSKDRAPCNLVWRTASRATSAARGLSQAEGAFHVRRPAPRRTARPSPSRAAASRPKPPTEAPPSTPDIDVPAPSRPRPSRRRPRSRRSADGQPSATARHAAGRAGRRPAAARRAAAPAPARSGRCASGQAAPR